MRDKKGEDLMHVYQWGEKKATHRRFIGEGDGEARGDWEPARVCALGPRVQALEGMDAYSSQYSIEENESLA